MIVLADVNVNNPNGSQILGVAFLIILACVAVFFLVAAVIDQSLFSGGLGFAILGVVAAAIEAYKDLRAFMWIGVVLAVIGAIMGAIDKAASA